MTKPLMWNEIIKVRSKVSKKAHAIARDRFGLPTVKTRGAYLLIHNEQGKQLIGSTDHGFPMCGKDWQAIKASIKQKHPTAHTLHLSIVVDSARGWRDYEAGDVTPFTGTASAEVHRYCDDGGTMTKPEISQ